MCTTNPPAKTKARLVASPNHQQFVSDCLHRLTGRQKWQLTHYLRNVLCVDEIERCRRPRSANRRFSSVCPPNPIHYHITNVHHRQTDITGSPPQPGERLQYDTTQERAVGLHPFHSSLGPPLPYTLLYSPLSFQTVSGLHDGGLVCTVPAYCAVQFRAGERTGKRNSLGEMDG